MPLSVEERKKLDELGVYNVQLKLQYAGPGEGSVVPGLLNGMVLRGDVERWLAEKNAQADKLQSQTLAWTKRATWAGLGAIAIAIIIALGQKYG